MSSTQPEPITEAADQLGISVPAASEQIKRLILLTGEEQLSGKFVGDMQLTFGLYTLLKETADFLVQADVLASSPPWPRWPRSWPCSTWCS